MNRTEVMPDVDAYIRQIEQDRDRLVQTINSRPGYEGYAQLVRDDTERAIGRVVDLESQRRVA